MSLDQSKIVDTIVQHDEIHLEDYLIEKRTQFKPFELIKQGEKIKHPIYVTVEYSRKFRNLLVLKHGEIIQTNTTW